MVYSHIPSFKIISTSVELEQCATQSHGVGEEKKCPTHVRLSLAYKRKANTNILCNRRTHCFMFESISGEIVLAAWGKSRVKILFDHK